jgi:hypothetical protein
MKNRRDSVPVGYSDGKDDDPEMWSTALPQNSWRGRPPLSLRFGDPSRLFATLADVLAPVAPVRLLVLPATVLALSAAHFNNLRMERHLAEIALTQSFLQNFVLGLLVSNLLAKIVQGITMARWGADCDEIGMRLAFGIIPKFYISKSAIRHLDFPEQRRCYGAPLLFRIAVYACGTLLWTMFFRTGSGLAEAALAIAIVGLGSFLFTANPLLPADGYRYLAAVLKRPRLRTQAFRLIGMLVRFRPLPRDLREREFWLLLLYGIGALGFTAYVIFWVVTTIALALETRLQGVGVVIFCLMIAAVFMFGASHAESRRNKRQAAKGRRNAR